MFPNQIFILCFIATFCLVQVHSATEIIQLNEDNWRAMLEGEWMVEFYAPWCPACKTLEPVWLKYASLAQDEDVKVAQIDVTQAPSLSGRFFVTALPTIFHVKTGQFRQYRGARDIDTLTHFIRDERWKAIEQISYWKQPDSFLMSLLSYFFKLSHYLKDINTTLHDQYGLPTWGAYALFAMSTILIGAFLGLLLVCIVDFLYPPKKAHRQSFSDSNKNLESSVEDVDDDLEDDEPAKEPDTDEIDDNKVVDEDDSETSEGEKNSNSEDSDADENGEGDTKTENVAKNEKKSTPPEVRKRKPRKAD